jgi:predicted dehydrogenase
MADDKPLTVSRRKFIGAAAGATAGALIPGTACSYARIRGANDRIQVGMIGCGARADGLLKMVGMSRDDGNLQIRSVCDLWTVNRDRMRARVKRELGDDAAAYKYSEDMLADPDLDAVIVATGDHQHARILAEVVNAGKDCYCEKPMANTLADAKLARDAVKATGRIVQMGSQWVSDPYHLAAREVVRSGKLGKITQIEQSWNYNGPRWHVPKSANIAALREEDTDWERWLLGRPARPFDPVVYFEFRLFSELSGGITDQWYSHGSGLAHFFLDTFIPDDTVANGGIFAWHDVRENPDTLAVASTFKEREVLYKYGSCYGNIHGNTTVIRGTRGTLYAVGGEGSPQWWYAPETYSGWGSNLVFGDPDAPDAKPEPVLPEGVTEIAPTSQSDDSKWHMDDWVRGMRARKPCHGSIETGFAHSVAVVMATRSYREGKKMLWDREREEIREQA